MSAINSAHKTIPGKSLNVYGLNLFMDMGVGIGGDKWPAAEQFCELIMESSYHSFFRDLFEGKRVIELGSGNGMVGLLINRLFNPSHIVISDTSSHVDHIQFNIDMNKSIITGKSTKCYAVEFDWLNIPGDIGIFDVVLAFEW